MKDTDRQTRSRLMRLFEQHGRPPRHDLGQNFLVDLNLHDMIVRHARLSTADVVLEVGAGTGGLTSRLADSAGHVVSVEFDEHVYGHAKHLLAGRGNVSLILGDALANKSTLAPNVVAEIETALGIVHSLEQSTYGREDLDADTVADDLPADEDDNPWALKPAETTLKLVANLPYNIATPLMSNLVASELPWSLMVVTIQWELAERMIAPPGSGDYSALSVWLQAQADLKLIRKLPPTVFWPPPKVDSAILRLQRSSKKQARIVDRAQFHDLVRDIFTLRRKQILGVLTQKLAGTPLEACVGNIAEMSPPATLRERLTALLEHLQIPPTSRPEQMTVEQFVLLSNALANGKSVPASDT